MPQSAAERVTECTNLSSVAISTSTIGTEAGDNIALQSGQKHLALVTIPTLSGGALVDFQFQWSATATGTYAATTSVMPQESVGGKTNLIEVDTSQIIQAYPTATYIRGYLKQSVAAAAPVMNIITLIPPYLPTQNTSSKAGSITTILG